MTGYPTLPRADILALLLSSPLKELALLLSSPLKELALLLSSPLKDGAD